MPALICMSCGAKHLEGVGVGLRAGTCPRCASRLEREHTKVAAVAPFYDPAASIVLGIDLVSHGAD